MKCQVRNIEINYEVYGEGRPIVMIHGFYPDHRLMTGCFEPIFESGREYKRIYIDLPGMGQTRGEAWIKNADIMLDIVIEFINSLIPNENFLLAGESYGAYLSRGIVHKMADRVDGLLLLCPCIIADARKRDRPPHRVLKRDADLLQKLSQAELEDFTSMAVVQTENTWKRYNDEILCGVSIANDAFLTNYQENGYAFSFDLDQDVTFEKPSLFLLGRQDASVGYKDAWPVQENYPRATFCVLDSAGHNLQIEQVELFNALVKEWLVRVHEASINKAAINKTTPMGQ